jgi:hypothetical protein
MSTKRNKVRLIVEMEKEEKDLFAKKINDLGQTLSTATRRALRQYLKLNN